MRWLERHPRPAPAARRTLAAGALCLGLLTVAVALEHSHHEQQAGAAGHAERGQLAGFVWGALMGAIIVLLFSYLSWRRQELQLEQVAAEREKLLAFERRRLALREARHHAPEPDGSTSGSASGHASVLGTSAEAVAELHPQPAAAAAGGASAASAAASPPSTRGAPSVAGGSTQSSASLPTPRHKSELKMIEEFLCTLVGRGSDRGSKGSHSSPAASGTSSSPLSLPLGISPDHSPLVRSGHNTGLVCSGHTASGQTRTELEKLPPGFADISPADISLIKELGEGSYGEVWLASYCQTLVAVKIASRARHANLTATLQQQVTLRNLRNEASLMATLNHPNICRYLGACLEPPLMVLEYCANKSLDALLADGLVNPETRKELTWERLLGMALDAANGMKFLHTRQPAAVAHRDLKSANLLVDAGWHCKVSDFGLSRAVDASKAASTVLVTNPRWLAPCVLSGLPGQLAADVWAFGTIMWECATWQLPFENLNPYQIIALVREHGTDSLQLPPPDQLEPGPFAAPGNYEAYHQLMRDCRAADPNQRPSFIEIVSRLGAIREREAHACHPELDLARRLPTSSAETLKTFRLPPDGPAHKSAIAALQRRRSALIQGRPGGSGAGGSATAPTGVSSAPPAGVTASASAKVSSAAFAGSAPAVMGSSVAVASAAGRAPATGAGSSTAKDISAEGGAGDSAPVAGSGPAGSADKAAKAADGAAGTGATGEASAAAPAPATAAAVAAAAVFKVGSGATDAPVSPSPTDAAPLDFTRS